MELTERLSAEWQDIEGALAERDRGLLEEESARPARNQGTKMIESLGQGSDWVNVVPGGKPGKCRAILVVALGAQEDAEPRILEAVEHIHVKCKGTTTKVVFWAAWWDPRAWVRHRDSFKGVEVRLKMIGMSSFPL